MPETASPARGRRDVAKRLIGTWRLISITTASGQDDPIRGPHPIGLIMYDAHGNMAVQIMPDRKRPKFALNKATPEQAQAALLGYTAYFGTAARVASGHVAAAPMRTVMNSRRFMKPFYQWSRKTRRDLQKLKSRSVPTESTRMPILEVGDLGRLPFLGSLRQATCLTRV